MTVSPTTDRECALLVRIEELDRREADLLEANNRYLERARTAERERDDLREAVLAGARVGAVLASELAAQIAKNHTGERGR